MTVSDTSSPESVKATPAVIPIVAIFAGVSAAVGAINGVIDLVTKIQSARSVVVEVDNNTDLLLTRTGDNLVHGGYAKDPDHEIAPHAPLVFGGVSRGLFTGTEGYVDWAAGPVTFRIHWDCPYVGTNSANVQVLGPDAGHYQAFVTAGAGNTAAQMKFELFRSGADFVSQTPPPATLNPGQTVQVAVTMKNTSIHPWTSASAFALGSQNPQDNTQWGSGRIGLAHDVAPGEQVTFTFPLTAPTSAGYFNFSWRMVQDGVAWFGDYTPPCGSRSATRRQRSPRKRTTTTRKRCSTRTSTTPSTTSRSPGSRRALLPPPRTTPPGNAKTRPPSSAPTSAADPTPHEHTLGTENVIRSDRGQHRRH